MGPQLVDHLLYEKEDNGILWIKFNRPELMNALYGTAEAAGTVAKVGEYMRAGDDDPDVRVIVLTGVGRGFCSGADLKGRPSPAEIGPRSRAAAAATKDPTRRASISTTVSPSCTGTSASSGSRLSR